MSSRQAFFLPAVEGFRFALFTPAESGSARGALLYIHPFGEELNKTRHLVAVQVRQLAQAGFDVLQIDLAGCGDSSGDFGEASWETWLNDVVLAADYLRERSVAPLWLWGLRAGALLAVEGGRRLAMPCNFLLWQPFVDDTAALQQILRMGAAAGMLNSDGKGGVGALKAKLADRQSIEIGGYTIAPELAEGLRQATIKPAEQRGKLLWIDVTRAENGQILPSTAALLNQWQDAGHVVVHGMIKGPAFWQSAELETAPELLRTTLHELGKMS